MQGRNDKGQFEKGNKVRDKYKKEYCEKMLEFFSNPQQIFKTVTTYHRDGSKTEHKIPIGVEFPMFEKFAESIGVTHKTLKNWCKNHDRFSTFYERAGELQKYFLVINTLNKNYDSSFAKFFATNNMDMKDKVDSMVEYKFSSLEGDIDEESN